MSNRKNWGRKAHKVNVGRRSGLGNQLTTNQQVPTRSQLFHKNGETSVWPGQGNMSNGVAGQKQVSSLSPGRGNSLPCWGWGLHGSKQHGVGSLGRTIWVVAHGNCLGLSTQCHHHVLGTASHCLGKQTVQKHCLGRWGQVGATHHNNRNRRTQTCHHVCLSSMGRWWQSPTMSGLTEGRTGNWGRGKGVVRQLWEGNGPGV